MLLMIFFFFPEFRVGQSVHVAGRVGVQILGDARGELGRIRGAQGARVVGLRPADRERHGVLGHAGQQLLAGPSAGGRAGRTGGHVLRAGGPQRRVRDTVGGMGAAARARAPRRQRAHGTRAAGAGTLGDGRRAARRRAHPQRADVLVVGAGEDVEVFERVNGAAAAGRAELSLPIHTIYTIHN